MFGYVKLGIRAVCMCELLSVFALMLLHMCVSHINNVCRKSTNAGSHNEELIEVCARAMIFTFNICEGQFTFSIAYAF